MRVARQNAEKSSSVRGTSHGDEEVSARALDQRGRSRRRAAARRLRVIAPLRRRCSRRLGASKAETPGHAARRGGSADGRRGRRRRGGCRRGCGRRGRCGRGNPSVGRRRLERRRAHRSRRRTGRRRAFPPERNALSLALREAEQRTRRPHQGRHAPEQHRRLRREDGHLPRRLLPELHERASDAEAQSPVPERQGRQRLGHGGQAHLQAHALHGPVQVAGRSPQVSVRLAGAQDPRRGRHPRHRPGAPRRRPRAHEARRAASAPSAGRSRSSRRARSASRTPIASRATISTTGATSSAWASSVSRRAPCSRCSCPRS